MEVGIASVLMAMLVSGALLLAADQFRTSAAQASGTALASLNTAVNQYESQFANNLSQHTAVPIPGYGNVANPYAPTPLELKELGFLKTDVPSGQYGISINTTVLNGTPSGMVWLMKQFTDYQGRPSQDLAAAAMLSAGGDAAISTLATPSIVSGADGWSTTNPQTNTAAILAMRNGAGSAAYVRLDGSTPMQGDLSFNGHNASNINTVNAATVSAASVSGSTVTGTNMSATNLAATNITGNTLRSTGALYFGTSVIFADGWNSILQNAGGALYVETTSGALAPTVSSQFIAPAGNGVQVGAAYYYGDSWNSAVRQNGTFYVQNLGGGTADANVNNLTANGFIYVGGWANNGWGCSPNGAIGRDGDGPLFCVDGVWKKAGGASATHVTQYGMPGGVDGTWDIGWHNFCALSEYNTYQRTVPEVYPVSGPNGNGQYDWNMSTCNTGSGCNGGSYGTAFMCWDFN